MTWQEGSHMQHRSRYVRCRRQPRDHRSLFLSVQAEVASTEILVEASILAEASILLEAAEAVMVARNADTDDGY
jgi:hypothetical protein